ncbi:ABC transporter substrate-binding protein [Pontibacter oryzae]|uniref:Leucine-binding protein domain-containing protein n=1 Tax=Pontibacter oryzae TaxID=2304593 RepID=A0A399SIE4_9BACT|nr:ABC transporter substrate-binding protein [Pontibacter oryzae]RIJ41495.1 hypothetical protein D1627_05510 [Pontibacter oryzae]
MSGIATIHRALYYQIAVLVTGAILVGFILYKHFYAHTSLTGYYTIGVILNNIELSKNDLEVVHFVIDTHVNIINQQGGIDGRQLRVKYLDDKGSPAEARKVVEETIGDRNLIGYVGCWSSTRSKAISEVVGPAGVPFIGGYSLTPLFKDYPNMFTYEQSIKDVEARFELLLKGKYKRPSFIGKAGDLYSFALLDKMRALEKTDPEFKVVLEKWYPANYQFKQADLDSLSHLLAGNSDFLLLSFESVISSTLIKHLRKTGVNLPVFTGLGDLGFVASQTDGEIYGELYDLSVIGIPGTFNLRLQEQIPAFQKEVVPGEKLDLQLSFGARMADAIGLMASAAQDNSNESPDIRTRINRGLERYISGSRIYRGWFDDWYFTPERSKAGDVLLAWKPPSLSRHILAPEQYLRINDSLSQVPVLYTHIDMVQINRVSDLDRSFYATFYLQLSTNSEIAINQIDFTNAARSETSHEYLLDIKLLSRTRQSVLPTLYEYLYKVSGKFLFEPDLRNYPFDKQKFSIHFQPSAAVQPFLVQPSATALNDSIFDMKGWEYVDQYVGYDHDLVSFVNTFKDQQRTLPFYKFSYTYVLARARVDFFLKVLTPLLVILIVSYFSVFIPLHRFETMEAMQVTSLLASIALYFSAYKPVMEYATISDKIFIFTYVMITSLIGTSIVQFVKRKKYDTESQIAKVYQHYVFPAIIVVFTLLIVS